MKEYSISYSTKENEFGDVIYHIKTKKEAIRQAKELLKKGNVIHCWIDIHVDDDIVGDIKIL